MYTNAPIALGEGTVRHYRHVRMAFQTRTHLLEIENLKITLKERGDPFIDVPRLPIGDRGNGGSLGKWGTQARNPAQGTHFMQWMMGLLKFPGALK